jgi:protocatechuate 3,4-dioxygenase beta subunit
MPRSQDADLVRVRNGDAAALGQVTHVQGALWDDDGRPVPGALIEIWQCDANGRYLHTADAELRPRDLRFQGYGRTTTGPDGAFRFRTIKPVSYQVTGGPLRTPHIHVAVSTRGVRRLTTQLYVEGEPLNAQDIVLARTPEMFRPGLISPYTDGSTIEPGALTAGYDLVLV